MLQENPEAFRNPGKIMFIFQDKTEAHMGAPIVTDKDLLLLASFRSNARKTLTHVSKDLGLPISTVFEKLKRYERWFIKRYTALLDFQRLGYAMRAHVLIKTGRESREELKGFLMGHENVNTLCRVSNGYDFVLEGIFKNMQEFHEFNTQMERFEMQESRELFILDDLKREEFLREKL
jgi:DNA-binding Lrp family transcriptional regulator